MYAVIETGSKQYLVEPGQIIQVEKLEGEKGGGITFDQVLWVREPSEGGQTLIGKPKLESAKVEGKILSQGRGDKITIVKLKRRKQYRRKQGHRQWLTDVLITSISAQNLTASLAASDEKERLSHYQSQLRAYGA